MEAEQLTDEKCKSSRIPYLLRCSFNFPRNVEMDVPGLGSLLSVFRASQSRGLACSKARLPLLQGNSAGGQTTASSAAAWAGAGWEDPWALPLALPANRRGHDHGVFSGLQCCNQQTCGIVLLWYRLTTEHISALQIEGVCKGLSMPF